MECYEVSSYRNMRKGRGCDKKGLVWPSVFHYVGGVVPKLAKMHDKRMKGFRTMGYEGKE